MCRLTKWKENKNISLHEKESHASAFPVAMLYHWVTGNPTINYAKLIGSLRSDNGDAVDNVG